MLLADMRKRVNDVDDEILRLLNKRAAIVADIARMKFDAGLTMRDTSRERVVRDRMVDRNSGPLYWNNVFNIYDVILSEFLKFEIAKCVEWMHEKQNPPPVKVGEGIAP